MKKRVDAVKLQREIRAALGKKYLQDPQGFSRELSKKYGGRKKKSSQRVTAGPESKSR